MFASKIGVKQYQRGDFGWRGVESLRASNLKLQTKKPEFCLLWFFHSSFLSGTRFKDIALLKISRCDPISKYRIARLCQLPVAVNTRLGTCGLGTTNKTALHYPDLLKEAHLFQTNMKLDPIFGFSDCREDQICTYSASNTCLGDEGGPLYTFEGSFIIHIPSIKYPHTNLAGGSASTTLKSYHSD